MGPSARRPRNVGSKLSRRLGGAIRFVAIVWAISGAFLALHLGLPELTNRLLVAGLIPADWALPDRGAPSPASACAEPGVPDDLGSTQSTGNPAARFASWKLGQELGFAAGMANLGRTSEQLAPLMHEVEGLAAGLGLPKPRLPEVAHVAYALTEYQAFVRADPQCVAARLSSRFGAAAGDLYRFGLVVGYVVPARAQGSEPLFPAEIRHYGELAGIPEDLYRPLAEELATGSASATLAEHYMAIVDRMDAYVRVRE